MSGRLAIEGVESGYGRVPVLHDVSITIDPGEVVALLGLNGTGKSTLLRRVSGLLATRNARSASEGRASTVSAHKIARIREAHVVDGRGILPNLGSAVVATPALALTAWFGWWSTGVKVRTVRGSEDGVQ